MSTIPLEPSPFRKGYRPFLLVVLFFSLYLALLILRPFVHTLMLAIVLASLFYPVQERLTRFYRGRRSVAALTVVLIIVFVIVIPVLLFFSAMVSQGVETIDQINTWLRDGKLQELLESRKVTIYIRWLEQHLRFLDLEKVEIQDPLVNTSKNVGQFLISQGANLLGQVAKLVSDFFIMMFIIFYFVRDGKKMIAGMKYLSPLREDQENRIIEKVRVVARSVLLGSFITGLCQGVAGGIGLAITGIPGLFWGTVMGFASLIPVVGTALVWVPAVLYLLLLGSWKTALFLTLWSAIVVGSIDNFLRPFFMGGETGMSPFYIFLAIIGGVQQFGLIGILYGPLILSFCMVMLYIYGVEYKDLLLQGQGKLPFAETIEEAEEASESDQTKS